MTKQEAQAAYRSAWRAWCFAKTVDAKRAAEQAMDAVQMDCTDARRPGHEWESFIDTLPGYRESWKQMSEQAEAMFKKLGSRSEK